MKSHEILLKAIELQKERGRDYDEAGLEERSHVVVCRMFNILRGKELAPSDIFLILEFVKLARQYSYPERLHLDSVLDKTSYSSLWGESLIREHGGVRSTTTQAGGSRESEGSTGGLAQEEKQDAANLQGSSGSSGSEGCIREESERLTRRKVCKERTDFLRLLMKESLAGLYLNSPDLLPPVDTPLVILIVDDEGTERLVRVKRTCYIASKDNDMIYEDSAGLKYQGRFKWTYP